ncbi:hypothetical protein [Enterococcus sp. N249-2]
MSSLKEKISEAIRKHIGLENTYTYELTRHKSAFEAGTMSLEDFAEWTDENVDDLATEIVDELQPQLNPNQVIVLDWLKGQHAKDFIYILYAYIRLNEAMSSTNENTHVISAYKKLSEIEFAQVLELYAKEIQDK